MFDYVLFFPIPGYFVEVGFPNVGELFKGLIPEGLPAEVRLLSMGALSNWLIPRGVPLCARFPSTSTRCIPEEIPEVLKQFHNHPPPVLLFVDEL